MEVILFTCKNGSQNASGVPRAAGTCASSRDQRGRNETAGSRVLIFDSASQVSEGVQANPPRTCAKEKGVFVCISD